MVPVIVGVVGSFLIWIPRLSSAEGPLWPTVLAFIGLWSLIALLLLLRRR